MATLTTSQKAPLVVTTEAGATVRPAAQTIEIAGDSCVHIANTGGGDGTNYVVADAPGTATLTVSSDGQLGTLEVVVTPAPLSVALGVPVAK